MVCVGGHLDRPTRPFEVDFLGHWCKFEKWMNYYILTQVHYAVMVKWPNISTLLLFRPADGD